MTGRCNMCALQKIKNGNCHIFNKDMTDGAGCPMYTHELAVCNRCGRAQLKLQHILYHDDDYVELLCDNCINMAPCNTCLHGVPCNFHNDSYRPELPRMITKIIQQGNNSIQVAQPNPERMKEICFNCQCCWREEGSEDRICLRDEGGVNCSKYEFRR